MTPSVCSRRSSVDERQNRFSNMRRKARPKLGDMRDGAGERRAIQCRAMTLAARPALPRCSQRGGEIAEAIAATLVRANRLRIRFPPPPLRKSLNNKDLRILVFLWQRIGSGTSARTAIL
jgi:hypothetical protein